MQAETAWFDSAHERMPLRGPSTSKCFAHDHRSSQRWSWFATSECQTACDCNGGGWRVGITVMAQVQKSHAVPRNCSETKVKSETTPENPVHYLHGQQGVCPPPGQGLRSSPGIWPDWCTALWLVSTLRLLLVGQAVTDCTRCGGCASGLCL